VIEQGYLYLCQPPLYRVSTGKVTRYAKDEKARDQAVKELSREGKTKNISVQRFKGLGEMNAEQLWETTMNPDTRTLLQISVREAADADEVFSTLMGEKVEPRRDFIRARPARSATWTSRRSRCENRCQADTCRHPQVEGKTGRKLEDWCALLEANGVGERREAVNFLRDGYAVSHAFALAIARTACGPSRRRVRGRLGRARRRPLVSRPRQGGNDRQQPADRGADGRRYAFADHNCFACGGTNPIGMHLRIELGEGTASTTWVPGRTSSAGRRRCTAGSRHAARRGDGLGAVELRLVGGHGRDVRSLSLAGQPGEALTRAVGDRAAARIYRSAARSRRGWPRHRRGPGQVPGASPSDKASSRQRYGVPAEMTAAGRRE
jgi:hypothetical protein